MRFRRVFQWLVVSSIVLFTLIVFTLQQLQPGYNWMLQPMSELALGPYGAWMFLAFAAIFVTLSSVGYLVFKTKPVLTYLLVTAAILFLMAGFVTLKTSLVLHVVLVGIAFVLSGLCMYAFPRIKMVSQPKRVMWISWGALTAMALTIGCTGSLLPSGLAQRLAAVVLLSWLLWVAYCLE